MSYAEATAPSRRAVAIACNPATPAPMMSTRPGVIVPAAVVSIGKMRGKVSAAMMTALYPQMVPIEESASILCARVDRGINSTAKEVTPVIRTEAQDLNDDVGRAENLRAIRGKLRALCSVVLVPIAGFDARAGFDENFEARFRERGHGGRDNGDAALARIAFLWHT